MKIAGFIKKEVTNAMETVNTKIFVQQVLPK